MKKSKNINIKYAILIISILTTLFVNCTNCVFKYTCRQPEFIDDGLEVGTLEHVGIDSQMIAKAVGCIYANKFDQVHSMLIYKDSMLVFEEYFEGNKYKWNGPNYYGERIRWDKDSMHVIMSCSKSITSACIGVAVDKGYIKSVHESIFNYLPDHLRFKTDGRDKITIEYLLTMTSGLKWNEWGAHDPSTNDIDRLYSYCQSDPVSCVLEKPLANNPSEKFTYNGGGMIILGEILRNATNMNIEDFSKMYLFEPLGIDSVQWYRFANGTYACDGSIIMTPRDMLKFGVTYLNEGKWNSKRILSKEWVEKSKKAFNNNTGIDIPIDDSGKNGYAYSWWTNEISFSGKKVKLFQAGGWGGQEIIVFPEYKMVVVFTGGNYTVKKHIYKILEKYVLPAIE